MLLGGGTSSPRQRGYIHSVLHGLMRIVASSLFVRNRLFGPRIPLSLFVRYRGIAVSSEGYSGLSHHFPILLVDSDLGLRLCLSELSSLENIKPRTLNSSR